MLVMKFGGTSVANADRIRRVADLAQRPAEPVVIVTSGMAGVTDELIALGELACARNTVDLETRLAALRQRHLETAEALTTAGPLREALGASIRQHMLELDQLLQGVRLIQEVSPRTSDLLVSFGERLAAPLLAAAIETSGGAANAVDARELIVTESAFGGQIVRMDDSRARTRDALLGTVNSVIPVVTGFIASSVEGRTTTLGRGGSDYTATLLGAFLDADEIWIWTDVNGVMTADPRVVPEARVLEAITYREAAEMAYFGSKVMHPRTIAPAMNQGIPVLIRNSYEPDAPGTRISPDHVPSAHGVKTVTSVPGLSLVTIEGNGLQGVPGVARRVFTATAQAGANVYMMSQASSEQNISLVVHRDEGPAVARALEDEFQLELARGRIDRVDVRERVGIVATIGEGMKGTPGISQRLFTALGRVRINVLAIAQGSSELNCSVVVNEDDLHRAVGAIHSRFGLTRDTHLLVLGKGLVGRALMRQIVDARHRLTRQHGVDLKVIGVCGSDSLLFDINGIEDERLLAVADGTGFPSLGAETRPDDAALFDRVADSHWLDVIVVDVTAEDHGALHADALRRGFHVVTANKKPMSGPQEMVDRILATAAEHGVEYHFETTFGAGLPALSTMQDFMATSDVIHCISGCLSGTLGYLCTELQRGRPLSEAVTDARERGYTEPDPRDDLSGLDVARKALIIARQLGARLELSDVALDPLVPLDQFAETDVATFMSHLSDLDDAIGARVRDAAAAGRALRYVAEIAPDRVSVGLREVEAGSAVGQLDGPDNILVFRTERYHDYPLIIRGPGAGAEVTAAGVLGDILKILRTV